MIVHAYRNIDHIVFRLREAESLYSLFSETFGLPVSWPLQRSDFATFGWVTVGNVNLEFWASSNNADLPIQSQPPLIHGFALEPVTLSDSISLLSHRGVTCKQPRAYRTPASNGEQVTNFTNSVIQDVSSDSCCIFFCEWGADGNIFPWKESLSTAERRARDEAAFAQCAGGTLGIVGLREIELSTPDLASAKASWQTLTGVCNDTIHIMPDITLRLIPGPNIRITSLAFGVRSLQVARNFLEQHALLAEATAEALVLSPDAVNGLNLRLIAASA